MYATRQAKAGRQLAACVRRPGERKGMAMVVERGRGVGAIYRAQKGAEQCIVWLTADVQNKRGWGAGCARLAHVMSLVQVS